MSQGSLTMMPISSAAVATEKRDHPQLRGFIFRVFAVGLMLGIGIGQVRMQHFHIAWEEMPGYRWWSVGWCALSAVFLSLDARGRWRKLTSPANCRT
jgi:hypothetical protein